MTSKPLTRRTVIRTTAAGAALGIFGAPHVAKAQAATLRMTTWGGRWGDLVKRVVIPAFEQEHKCKVEVDTAFPFIPKLQASPKNAPIYDVLHANSNEQWAGALEGLVTEKLDPKDIPNLKDVHAYAVSERMVGVAAFTNAIGLGYRTDKGFAAPTSWKDLADRRHDGQRGMYTIPANSFGQQHLMMLGQVYGSGLKDLDAAYKALEQHKPMKIVDFAGQLEKMLVAGEIGIGILHDSGIYRNLDQNLPIDFAAPKEGILSLEQVWNVTPGSKVKELAHAYINFLLSPAIQKQLAEEVWYAPANKTVTLAPKYAKLPVTPEQVAKLIQVDWKWYLSQKDQVDARVTRILRG